MAANPVCPCMGLAPRKQTIFHGLMGHWEIYSTYQADIHVGLLNLLSSDVFSRVKMVKNVMTAGAPPPTHRRSL